MKENKMKTMAWLIISVSFLITIFFGYQIVQKSRMETDLDKYMPQDHPAFVYSDQAEAWFNIKDGILIAVENEQGIYNSGTLQKIKDITLQLQAMPEFEAADVVSLFTADNIVGTEDGLDVRSFYREVPSSAEVLKKLQSDVETNEMVHGRLVSEKGNVALVVAALNDTAFSMEFYQNILAFAHSFEGPEKVYVAGVPVVEGTMAFLGPKDMKTMVPIVVLAIVLVLYTVMRSVRNTFSTLMVVLLSTVWTFGLLALLNIPIYAVSIMIPVMLIAIGVADGIHLYSHLDLFLMENKGATKVQAITNMLKNMWKPVMMTSVTTAIGFISLLTSEVLPIKYFGLFTAFGVMAAMVFSLFLIPSFIFVLGTKKQKTLKTRDQSHTGFGADFAVKVLKYKVLVVSITVILGVISVVGIGKVWINSSFLEKL